VMKVSVSEARPSTTRSESNVLQLRWFQLGTYPPDPESDIFDIYSSEPGPVSSAPNDALKKPNTSPLPFNEADSLTESSTSTSLLPLNDADSLAESSPRPQKHSAFLPLKNCLFIGGCKPMNFLARPLSGSDSFHSNGFSNNQTNNTLDSENAIALEGKQNASQVPVDTLTTNQTTNGTLVTFLDDNKTRSAIEGSSSSISKDHTKSRACANGECLAPLGLLGNSTSDNEDSTSVTCGKEGKEPCLAQRNSTTQI